MSPLVEWTLLPSVVAPIVLYGAFPVTRFSSQVRLIRHVSWRVLQHKCKCFCSHRPELGRLENVFLLSVWVRYDVNHGYDRSCNVVPEIKQGSEGKTPSV